MEHIELEHPDVTSQSETECVCVCVHAQLFPQIEEAMVQPLRESRDRYEELKQIDDAMNEVGRSL